MMEIKRIMVALEFSESSPELFKFAAEFAAKMGTGLIAVNVIDSRDVDAISRIASMGYEIDGSRYVKEIITERKKLLDSMIKGSSMKPDQVREIFQVGRPANELLKVAVKEQVDIIIMGLKAHTEFEHFFVGSVAEKLFRRSPFTIVSYRHKTHAGRLKKRIRLN